MNKIRMTLSIDREKVLKLDRLLSRTKTSRSQYINAILQDTLPRLEQEPRFAEYINIEVKE